MKLSKFVFFISFFVFIMMSESSAKDWFVCLGSFREISNAERFKDELAAQSVPSFIY